MVIPSGIIPFVNFIVIGFIVISVVIGYKKGFVVQIFHLLGIVAAILVSWYFSPILAEKYEIFPQNLVPFAGTGFENMFYGRLNALLWHAALFFGALLLIFLIKPLITGRAYGQPSVRGVVCADSGSFGAGDDGVFFLDAVGVERAGSIGQQCSRTGAYRFGKHADAVEGTFDDPGIHPEDHQRRFLDAG